MYANRPGYYLPSNGGPVRHCHAIGLSTPEWHEASNPHPATPLAHADCGAWNPDKVVWARANDNLSRTHKRCLIDQARADWTSRILARGDINTPNQIDYPLPNSEQSIIDY